MEKGRFQFQDRAVEHILDAYFKDDYSESSQVICFAPVEEIAYLAEELPVEEPDLVA